VWIPVSLVSSWAVSKPDTRHTDTHRHTYHLSHFAIVSVGPTELSEGLAEFKSQYH
jgi:hypothetical protein